MSLQAPFGWDNFSLSLCLLTLTAVRSNGLVFCRMSIYWDLPGVFLMWLDWGYKFLGGRPQSLSALLISWNLLPTWLVTVDMSLDHLAGYILKVVFLGTLLTQRVTLREGRNHLQCRAHRAVCLGPNCRKAWHWHIFASVPQIGVRTRYTSWAPSFSSPWAPCTECEMSQDWWQLPEHRGNPLVETTFFFPKLWRGVSQEH